MKNINWLPKIAAFVISALCVSCLMPALAAAEDAAGTAENGTVVPENTTAVNDYRTDGFPDVPAQSWFYSDITRLTAEGVLNGYPDGNFYPDREITIAEFVKILIFSSGIDLTTLPKTILYPTHWSAHYLSLAYANGIITDDDLDEGFLPDAPITRSAMTRMMILALGIEPARIDDPFTDISDIYASTAYNEYLLRGYLLPDDTRVYRGESNATRAEACAIAVRIMDYRKDPYEYKKREILLNASENPLSTEFELMDLFYILNREFMTTFTFETAIPYETWVGYYLHSNSINIEYFYTSEIRTTIGEDRNTYTVQLIYNQDIDRLKAYHRAASEKADGVIASIITEGMSSADKIKAIHDYLVLNCAYDYNNYITGNLPFETMLAYGALCEQSAVCQGYCAAFNMLCDRVGIRSVMLTGTAPNSSEAHSWNMIQLDGHIYFIDVSHDDPVPDLKGRVSYKYYMLTEAEMTELGYVWNKAHSNLKYFY